VPGASVTHEIITSREARVGDREQPKPELRDGSAEPRLGALQAGWKLAEAVLGAPVLGMKEGLDEGVRLTN